MIGEDAMKEYTAKEMKLLKANPYTFKVTKTKLYFTTEFKDDYLSIDDFYKVYAYCCLYKSIGDNRHTAEKLIKEYQKHDQEELYQSV